MQIIGLTGSIASGKSTVSAMCARAGMLVHDADKAVHRVMGPHGIAVSEILSEFGQVGSVQLGIDRTKLADIVLTQPHKRKQLEAIIHPLVHQDRHRFIGFARQLRCRTIILDVPLLLETRTQDICDYVIVVWAPEAMLQKRALARPNMTMQKFEHILSAQMPQIEKKQYADLWLPTGLGRAYTQRCLTRWISKTTL